MKKITLKKVISIALNVLVSITFALGVFTIIKVVITEDNAVPNVFGISLLRVTTSSMKPELVVDDLIVVKSIDAKRLIIGDIISFYSDDPSLKENKSVNTHRITQIKTDEDDQLVFTTKGDANEQEDDYPVNEKKLIGKVVYRSKLLNKLIVFAQDKSIFFAFLIVPLVVIMVIEFSNLFRIIIEKKHDKSAEDESKSLKTREEEEQADDKE
ncbi:MAG TPA: signal peptidase I [Clostridia bacterium]|nr:signal peptidase I [Clostridia bacterium]